MSIWRRIAGLAIIVIALAGLTATRSFDSRPKEDEAKRAGRTVASFAMADENYFKDMDGGIELTRDEIIGRNMWLVWSGGNDRFWDEFTRLTFGGFDLLKIISAHPSQKLNRDERWSRLGLLNEPCFKQATGPDPKRFGLWLDVRDPSCPADPFANEEKYPGVRIGARGETVPVGSFYGEPTGIVGLRLFPNPDFDEEARKKWDAEAYYKTPECLGGETEHECDLRVREREQKEGDPIRPYRVGMTCAFCHVGPNPTRPPHDPANPRWSELNSAVGAQFLKVRPVFLPNLNMRSFLSQILETYRPGTIDTSLAGSDGVNNPRTMNAFYHLGPRMELAHRLGQEKLTPEQFRTVYSKEVQNGPLAAFFKPPDTVFTPHILKDGADSIGPLGALNRVYVNVGMFSEEWLRHFNPVIGGRKTSPFPIETARANSVYWQATEAHTPKLAAFFMRATEPHPLSDAPSGPAILAAEAEAAERGKLAFATACARCHSSKGPQPPDSIRTCRAHSDSLTCFKNWWSWTKTDDYKRQMTEIVRQPDFAKGNYFSSEVRIPVTLLRTNACSAVASNAIAGHVWDNFSSQTYKELPQVGAITVRDPFTGEPERFELPGGGRGYTRPPSLLSLWSTAPFLLNNSLGPTAENPSVEARLKAYDLSMQELLWPEKRKKDTLLGDKGVGWIDRTTERNWIYLPARYVPEELRGVSQFLAPFLPEFLSRFGDITLGPIPKGLPVNILANVRLVGETPEQSDELRKLVWPLAFGTLEGIRLVQDNASDAELLQNYARLKGPLKQVSTCKDYEVNRGHYFGTAEFNNTEGLTEDEAAFGSEPVLTDSEKRDLIAYLKTL